MGFDMLSLGYVEGGAENSSFTQLHLALSSMRISKRLPKRLQLYRLSDGVVYGAETKNNGFTREVESYQI